MYASLICESVALLTCESNVADGSCPNVACCASWSCVSGVKGVCGTSGGDGRRRSGQLL